MVTICHKCKGHGFLPQYRRSASCGRCWSCNGSGKLKSGQPAKADAVVTSTPGLSKTALDEFDAITTRRSA